MAKKTKPKRQIRSSREKALDAQRVPGRFRFVDTSGYCALPVAGDTYKGCMHNCLYCFERQTPNQHVCKLTSPVVPRDHKKLFQSLYSDPAVYESAVVRNNPLLIGTLSDPFPPVETWYRHTERVLALLSQAGFQYQLVTKAPNRIDDKHIAVMKQAANVMVRVSFSVLDDRLAKVLEPGCPPPTERLAAMRRLSDAGIQVGARLAPFLHTLEQSWDQRTYATLAETGCKSVTVDILAFSATWRHTWNPMIWAVCLGLTEYPDMDKDWAVEMSNKNSVVRRWAEQAERDVFAPLQSLDKHNYCSPGYHFIAFDALKVRQMFIRVRELIHNAGMKFGMCAFTDGIKNIDLNDPPCGCLLDGWSYDEDALVPAWHRNQWKDYLVHAALAAKAGLGYNRLMTANDPFYRPLALEKSYPTGVETIILAEPGQMSDEVLTHAQDGHDRGHIIDQLKIAKGR